MPLIKLYRQPEYRRGVKKEQKYVLPLDKLFSNNDNEFA